MGLVTGLTVRRSRSRSRSRGHGSIDGVVEGVSEVPWESWTRRYSDLCVASNSLFGDTTIVHL